MEYTVLITLKSGDKISYDTTEENCHKSLSHWIPLDDNVKSITTQRKE